MSDLIVPNSKKTALANEQRELLDLIDQGKFGRDKVWFGADVSDWTARGYKPST